MKKFLKNILIFGGLVGSFLGVNLLINSHRLTDPFELNKKVVIAGDSHLRTSLYPEILPNSTNMCMGGESYIMTFYKLKKALNNNPQIEKVLLGYSFNNFSAYRDERLIGGHTKSQMDKYYEVLPLDFPDHIPINESKFYHTFLRELTLYPNFSKRQYLGGFRKHQAGLDESDVDEAIRKHYYPEGKFVGRSVYTLHYLDSIIALTSTRNVELILISTPLHIEYQQKIPDDITEYYYETKLAMQKRDVRVLDFLNLVYEDSLFKDYDHLNFEGAKIFTTLVKEEIFGSKEE